MTIYSFDLGFDTLRLEMDLSQANAPISYDNGSGDFVTTQYQTADAQHDEWAALELVLQNFGTEYYGEDESLSDIVEYASLDIEEEE